MFNKKKQGDTILKNIKDVRDYLSGVSVEIAKIQGDLYNITAAIGELKEEILHVKESIYLQEKYHRGH